MKLDQRIAAVRTASAGRAVVVVGVADTNGHALGSFDAATGCLRAQGLGADPVWIEPDALPAARLGLVDRLRGADVLYKAVFGPFNRSGFVQAAARAMGC